MTRESPVTVALAGLAALAVAMGIGRFAFTPILPMMQEDAGLTVVEGGWLAAANYLGYLVGALSAIVFHIAAPTAIRSGLIAIGVTTGAMGFVQSFPVWLALRTVAGIASAWVMISISSWCVGRLAPSRRPLLNSTVFAGVGVGITATGFICLGIMYARASSPEAWIALGIASMGVSALSWPVFRADEQSVAQATGRPRDRRYRWDAESIRLVLCYGAFGFGYIIPATFVPAMARAAIRDPWIFGWAWPVFGAAAAVSTFSGLLSSTAGRNRRLWVLSQLVMAGAVVLPVFVPGITGIVLASLGVGGTFMVNTMAGMQEAREVADHDATGLMAAMTAAFATGQIAGPVSVSYLVGASGSFSTALLAAGLLLIISAWILAVSPSARRLNADASRS